MRDANKTTIVFGNDFCRFVTKLANTHRDHQHTCFGCGGYRTIYVWIGWSENGLRKSVAGGWSLRRNLLIY